MSLIAFQLALADLAASPDLCARVASDPADALAGRDLTEVERRRLASAAGQRGVHVNRALYRYNRINALIETLRGTLFLLGGEVRALADAFWAETGHHRNQRREAELFAEFVRAAAASGRVESPYLLEVMEFELRRYQVATAPRPRLLAEVADAAARFPDGPLALHPLLRIIRFAHEPHALIARVAERAPPPYEDVPEGDFYLLLDYRGEKYEQATLSPAWAAVIGDALEGREVAPEAVNRLIEAGFLVRTSPS